MKKRHQLLVGAAIAGFISGSAMADTKAKPKSAAPANPTNQVKCYGVNGCGGQGACHTVANKCAHQNSCKGKGVTFVGTEQECTTKGGTLEEKKKG